MFVWMCLCLFGLLYSCVISAQGDFVCALCVWLGFCCIGIPVFVCVYVCANLSGCTPSHFSCLLLAVLHTSISTFLRGFFAVSCQRIFSHSGCQAPASHASLSPTHYGEIKTCSVAPSKNSLCQWQWRKGKSRSIRGMWAERPHCQPHPCPLIDFLLRHTRRVTTQTLFESKKIAARVRRQLYISPCREWMQGSRNTSPLSLLCCLIRVRRACNDPYTLCRSACWALMETKATGHSVSSLSSCCPPHCPCIVPRPGCEKEQCLHYPWQPIISGQPTQTEKLARLFSSSISIFFSSHC